MWWVLHVDLDQFIAAVEVLRNPELAGKPVVVGGDGDPKKRSVVATASYEAREFGVHSGMPMRTAQSRCPDAIFLPSDPAAYDEASDRVMAVLREFPGGGGLEPPEGRRGRGRLVVEVLGWDEAFVGVETDDPDTLAADLQDAVWRRTSLSCAVGIGDNTLRAKIATGFAKPAGIYKLTRDNWVAVMADRPTEALWGIGAKTARKLADLGLHTVRQLALADPADLARRFGPKMGPWYWELARGAGGTTVSATPLLAKSRSREVTFQTNLTERPELNDQVAQLARRVAEDVAEEARPALRVGVKVRFAPFVTQTRSLTLPAPTSDPAILEKAALEVLDMFDHGRPVRLLGVWASFEDPDG
jgi:DNA polymerase-4